MDSSARKNLNVGGVVGEVTRLAAFLRDEIPMRFRGFG
jgi:hypothetical protein